MGSINLKFKRTVEILVHLSIWELKEAYNIEITNQTWIDPLLNYIQNRDLPIDKLEAANNGTLYQNIQLWTNNHTSKLYSRPLLRCLYSNKALRVLVEIHERHYQNHLGGWSLYTKLESKDYIGQRSK